MVALVGARWYIQAMKLVSRFHATMTLAYYALSPSAAAGATPATTVVTEGMTIHIIPADQFAAALASIDTLAASDGTIALLFAEATSAAAPFLLFRLKRTGFSACRVTRNKEGLLLTARR